jgi:hypothetical protein
MTERMLDAGDQIVRISRSSHMVDRPVRL